MLCAAVVLLSLCAAGQNSAPAAPQPQPSPSTSTAVVVPTLPAKPEPQPAYGPLTGEQKFHRFLHSTYAPYTWTTVLFSTTYAQMTGVWPTYGGGMEGFGKRFGATAADTEAAAFFKTFVFPTLLHQDPRYLPSHKEGIFPRFWYAGTRVLVTRNDSGRNGFNTSELLGMASAKALSNAYYPVRDRGFGETANRTFGAMLSDAGSNELREFWPDIRKLFVKHEPERMKKWEKRMPKVVSGAAGAAMGVPPEQQPKQPPQTPPPQPPPK